MDGIKLFGQNVKKDISELFDAFSRFFSHQNSYPKFKLKRFDKQSYTTLNNNNTIRYICFGVPGKMDTPPDDNLKEYSQWLPTDIKSPKDSGYWVMYQDAITGKNVVID